MNSKGIGIISAIAAISVALSVLSYESAINTSNEIARIADDNLKTNADTQAYDLSRIVSNKVRSVYENLEILANGPAVQKGDYQTPISLFSAAQSSTGDLTDYYMWIDENGKLVASSNMIKAAYDNPNPDHRSEPIFVEPMRTHAAYFSNITNTANDIEKVYVSYPILYSLDDNSNRIGTFKGIVVASISLDTLGTLLHNELVPGLNTESVALLDNEGIVVYATDKSFVGKDVFSNPSRSIFSSTPAENIAALNNIIQSRLGSYGSQDVIVDRVKHTLAYRPILHNGKQLWTLFIWTPHDFAEDVDMVIDRQSNFGILLITIISIVTVGIAYLVLQWNGHLGRIVNLRTRELRNSNEMLEKLNADLLKANEQLKVHGKMQEEFVNLAAHELRTPIMPILGITDLLESKFQEFDNEEIILKKQDFDIILRNSRRLERLATDILDVSRIETRSLHLNIERFDLYDLMHYTVTEVKNQNPNPNVTYVVKAEKGLQIDADKLKVSQVLWNLLNNAAKFTDQGKIEVRCKIRRDDLTAHENIILSVSDTGVGIDPEILPRLFTKFTNKAGSDRNQVGSGLGLYISKGIVEAHGGKIWAENNANGQGATFSFSLPLRKMERVKVSSGQEGVREQKM